MPISMLLLSSLSQSKLEPKLLLRQAKLEPRLHQAWAMLQPVLHMHKLWLFLSNADERRYKHTADVDHSVDPGVKPSPKSSNHLG